MDSLYHDLRYAARMLMKSPGFTAVAVIALALGIGANTAIFSVVNAILLRSLPYKDPDRIIAINKVAEAGGLEGIGSVEYMAWQEQIEVFEDLAAYDSDNFNLTGVGEPERISCARVSASAFTLLGIQPIAGRVFLPEEDRPGNNQVVVVSQGFWQRRYGGDPNLIGQAITLNDKPYTVVGIMPANFQFPRPYEIWLPLALDEKEKTGDMWTLVEVIARLKPGVTEERVESDLNTMAGRLAEHYRDWPLLQARFEAVPLHRHLVGDMRLALLVLLGAVGFVLAVACANVANLLLARAADRQKEMAIRVALGAGRWRVVRQLLTESVLLSLLGGALGILLALWSVDLLVSSIPQELANTLPGIGEVGIDRQALGFTLALSILTGIFFGLAPAFVASKPDVNETLKEGSTKIAAGSGLRSLRGLLVVSELALALVLLIGAGLLIKSFIRMLDVDPGYRPEDVLTMRVELPRSRYARGHQTSAFFKETIERMKELPEVESVGAISDLPLSGHSMMAFFQVEGPVQMERGKDPSVPIGMVSPDYFKTMGIPLLQGRTFTEQDADGATGVVIINESMARKFWPDENPIGKRIGALCGKEMCRTIVGVVGDVRHEGLTKDLRPEIYVPYLQVPLNSMAIVVRASADPMSLVTAARSQIQALDPDQPVSNIRTLEQHLSDSVAQPRLLMSLLGAFAALALTLAAVGIYGVVSYSVSQRTHEIGIRMALGAETGDVLRLVLGKSMALVFAGIAIGLGAALALTKVLSSLLFSVSATDPAIFILVSTLLALVALAASYLPARRATKVDPMVALRYE